MKKIKFHDARTVQTRLKPFKILSFFCRLEVLVILFFQSDIRVFFFFTAHVHGSLDLLEIGLLFDFVYINIA